jgi:hypothetical protein
MMNRFFGRRWTRRGELLLAIGVPLLAVIIYATFLPILDDHLDDSYYVVVHLPLVLLIVVALAVGTGLWRWRHRSR